MVIVVVAGLLMGGSVAGYRLERRRADCVRLAQYHAYMEDSLWRLEPRNIFEMQSGSRLEALLSDVDVALSRRVAYHAAMARKYRRAARSPWLPVEPDPPEPEP
jgi:hypothetical protein